MSRLLLFGLTVVCVMAAGCNQASTTEAQAPLVKSTKPDAVVVPHKLTEKDDPGSPAPTTAEKPKLKSTVPEVDLKTPSKIDPSVVGTYKLQLSAAQKAQIDSAIEKMRHDAENQVKGAESSLSMALAAKEMVEKLVVRLTSDGKFSADFGQGERSGKYTMRGTVLVLVPDDQPDDKDVPRDVELVFDKTKKTLRANFQGEDMVFEKKG